MKVFRRKRALIEELKRVKRNNGTVGFVPTMGFLHEGHMGLIRKAKEDTDCAVVSIFANPAQFGPKEDFKKYPRDLDRDLGLCRENNIDIVFAPDPNEIYPKGFCAYVNVEGITEKLCGASRPGHFRGVATVVAKLFNIVMPDIAYFGQKDAQQAVVIKRMVTDLDMPVKIRVMPIVREKDGLAMSSRNVYLNPEERKEALVLSRSLKLARSLHKKGVRDSAKIIKGMRDMILKERRAKIDYISIVDTERLEDVRTLSGKALVAIAVRIGKTRLIDNIILN